MKISFHITMNFIYKLDIATSTGGPVFSNVIYSKISIHYSEKSMGLMATASNFTFLKSNITSRNSKIEMLTMTVYYVMYVV